MRRAVRHLIARVARTGLLLVLAVGSPSLGGAFRCCSTGEHGAAAAHAAPDSTQGDQATGAASHAAQASSAATGAHGSHAGHASPVADAADRTGDAEPETPSSLPCDCVGDCCAPPALATVAPRVRLGGELRPESSAPAIARGDRYTEPRVDVVLPFANGPPHRLTV